VFEDAKWSDTLSILDRTSPYALTGAVFARDRGAIRDAADALRRGDVEELASYRSKAPGMPYAHPTVEHYTPLFVTLGAASDPEAPTFHQWGATYPHFGPHNHRRVRKGDVDRAFDEADVIVEGVYRPQAIEHGPLHPIAQRHRVAQVRGQLLQEGFPLGLELVVRWHRSRPGSRAAARTRA